MLVPEQYGVGGLQAGHVLEKVLLYQPETVDALPDRLENGMCLAAIDVTKGGQNTI